MLFQDTSPRRFLFATTLGRNAAMALLALIKGLIHGTAGESFWRSDLRIAFEGHYECLE